MLESQDEGYISKPIWGIHANDNNNSPKILAHNYVKLYNFSQSSMKKSVRPIFSFLLLIVVAATFGYRIAITNGFRSIYWESEYSFVDNDENPPLDLPVFNATLLKLAEIEVGETQLRKEIEQLLEENDRSFARFRAFPVWRRYARLRDPRARISVPAAIRSPEFSRVWLKFKRYLSDWSGKKRFEPNIMEELVDLVKVPIDEHNGVFKGSKKKYKSCAVVGNSGILLSKEYGELIDSHEFVIRLNNARIEPFQKNVGHKTSISFINSNILHLCTRRDDCFCHPYGSNVPIVMYMCQPAQFLDYVECSSSHKSPLIVTDSRFDMLCARIVKYYSLKRFGDGPNRTLEEWSKAHDGDMFHYSSGMQAVMLGLGVCERVSLFGFGKSIGAKHHYHTNQKQELSLHDYEAEYDFYRDLVERPRAIPFISNEFKFPPVVIHR